MKKDKNSYGSKGKSSINLKSNKKPAQYGPESNSILLNLYKLDFKVELFAGHLVIGI